jgi:two-component system, chemotaxis family, chemotaxis protein CheY
VSHAYLIIDDSKLLHQMYQLIFSRPALAGSRLIHAFDGKAGLAQLSAHPEVRLVFLDLNMPGLTGLEFLARRRAESLHLHVPIVMVTTESSAEDEQRGLAAGASAYLRKPFTPEQIEALVARVAQPIPVASPS